MSVESEGIYTARVQYVPGMLSVYLQNLTTPVLTVPINFASMLPSNELGSKMLLLDNWNEWSEGHYIAPYREYGFGVSMRKKIRRPCSTTRVIVFHRRPERGQALLRTARDLIRYSGHNANLPYVIYYFLQDLRTVSTLSQGRYCGRITTLSRSSTTLRPLSTTVIIVWGYRI